MAGLASITVSATCGPSRTPLSSRAELHVPRTDAAGMADTMLKADVHLVAGVQFERAPTTLVESQRVKTPMSLLDFTFLIDATAPKPSIY